MVWHLHYIAGRQPPIVIIRNTEIDMSDTIIKCVKCGELFTWSYGEQQFYRERGLSKPKHCPNCRPRRNAERGSGNKRSSGALRRRPADKSRWPTEFFQEEQRRTPARVRPKPTRPPQRRRPPIWWRNPYARFGLISLGAVLLAAIAALLAGLPWWFVLAVLVAAVNLITLAMYRYDKTIAGGEQTRVPEAILLALAFFGGSPAAYVAIYKFRRRHKAQKTGFVALYWAIVALQIMALCAVTSWQFGL